MDSKLARPFQTTIAAGLDLLERLERGEFPDLETEQARLKGCIDADAELKHIPDYAGDGRSDMRQSIATGAWRGLRYALACWLDEIVLDPNAAWQSSPWRASWNERKLETQLYGTNDRASEFWDQWELAQKRPGSACIEGLAWCAALGFRGQHAANPAIIAEKVRTVQPRILTAYTKEFALPPEAEAKVNVEPLTGKERMQGMMRMAFALILAAVSVGFFLWFRSLADNP